MLGSLKKIQEQKIKRVPKNTTGILYTMCKDHAAAVVYILYVDREKAAAT
jgi:hypothetical protein